MRRRARLAAMIGVSLAALAVVPSSAGATTNDKHLVTVYTVYCDTIGGGTCSWWSVDPTGPNSNDLCSAIGSPPGSPTYTGVPATYPLDGVTVCSGRWPSGSGSYQNIGL